MTDTPEGTSGDQAAVAETPDVNIFGSNPTDESRGAVEVEAPASNREVTSEVDIPPDGGAVKLRVEVADRAELRRWPYWVGVTRDCPVSCVHAGGYDFPFSMGKNVDDAGNPIKAPPLFGRIHYMSDAEAKLCIERIGERVVRSAGKKKRIYTVKAKVFTPRLGDVPLARYVYMHRQGATVSPLWQRTVPETMEA